jgi:carbon storage regulator
MIMLVLSRRLGEKIVIGDSVTISIVEIKGGQVRLGVTAPRSVRVDRDEVHRRRLHEADGELHEVCLVGPDEG